LFASDAGAPTLKIDSSTIQNTETGISALAGTATVSNSTIQFNRNGVVQGSDSATVNLSGAGGLGGTNTVVCSSNIESIHGTAGAPGVDVLNLGSGSLDADNVAWDTAGPDLFECDGGLTDCT